MTDREHLASIERYSARYGIVIDDDKDWLITKLKEAWAREERDSFHKEGFNHPCMGVCSGWKQGYDRGFDDHANLKESHDKA